MNIEINLFRQTMAKPQNKQKEAIKTMGKKDGNGEDEYVVDSTLEDKLNNIEGAINTLATTISENSKPTKNENKGLLEKLYFAICIIVPIIGAIVYWITDHNKINHLEKEIKILNCENRIFKDCINIKNCNLKELRECHK